MTTFHACSRRRGGISALSAPRARLWLLAVLLGTLCGAPPLWAETVSQGFARANKAFVKGDDKTAGKILRGLAKKYPDHQPTQLLLGRIAYRAGDIGRAARHFKKISADLVTAPMGYEYGVTMFTIKNCTRALAGFRRVPAASKLANLADFYSGVCYARGREWQKAQAKLAAAKGLPQNLEPTRRKALREVREALKSERRGNFTRANPYVIAPTPPPPPVAVAGYDPYGAPAAGPPEKKAEKPPPPPPPQTGGSAAITPSLTITQKAVSSDNFGYQTDDSESRETLLKLANKFKYDAAPRANGGQPYASLGLDVAQRQTVVTGTKVQYVANPAVPGEIIEQETDTSPGSTNNAEVTASPEVGFPMTKAIDLTAGFAYSGVYPDMKQETATTSAGPKGAVDVSGESTSLKLSGSQTVTETKGATPVKTTTVMSADGNKDFESSSVGVTVTQTEIQIKGAAAPVPPLPTALSVGGGTYAGTILAIAADASKTWTSFTLAAVVTNTTYSIVQPEVYFKSGEQSSLKVEVTGTKTFEFGGSFLVTAAMTQLNEFKKMVDDRSQPKDEAGAYPKLLVKPNGTSQSVLATFKLAPVDWVFGSASYKYTQTAYEISDAKTQLSFESTTPETTQEYTLIVGLQKTF